MKKIVYRDIIGHMQGFYSLLIILGGFILAALGSTYYMEHNGHWVTGMSNQIVWGTPHVFAVFLIVAASGALNVASIGSVFGKKMYKPLAPLSAIMAIALLIGGLMVLVLDLGRPDRLIVAMTTYNFKSIFAWNILLYNGFLVIVLAYLWTMMERRMNPYSRAVGTFAFVWRLVLTTGTGSIFGFLVARQAYDAAIMAPMFVVMSFAFGLAIFLLVLMFTYNAIERPLGDAMIKRMKNLLGVFVAGVLYFVITQHVTNLYATEHHAVERFILLDGGIYTKLFWIGQILLGSLVPLAILYHPKLGASRNWIASAAGLVILGGLIQMYVLIIGGQAFPLMMFPGYEVSSSFFDGAVNGIAHSYAPTLPEIMLGLGGFATALLLILMAVKTLHILPESLADEVVDPHH
ncbi:molybdopterin oxidoreductase [Solemya pervernicosa gill symbiont]|uniref:Molybdopterin oxidoreductase n=2 Tax=Gammaproteobacteria incertae sedis TaxID=118884 RepID=A0A1T2L6H8_9GAMM|nr:NrfD/PsrC family molybdoenzyme membrane anchor subunit [Candidatus Reidiella endopervernicosa]OOZ40691.1 molybdopterin oxidoreductase [Solemya pervernicosa gill symbiont]QKQ26755.1 polysulfide reductase NrfD [Candidatus Reidiella endopervernicosa]